MDYLWTPWRYQYVTTAGDAVECIFCAARHGDDAERLVVHRGRNCFVILNRFPYTSGHVMVVPHEHRPTLASLPEATAAELMLLARRTEAILTAAYRPDGLNLGINVGKSAGAGVAGHLHVHVLPRWGGDAGFITTVGETRVLPEDLLTTWQKLRAAFQSE